jgi:hypothetical protein
MTGRIPIRLKPLKNNDMNPNLSRLTLRSTIIISIFCCWVCAPGINPYPSIGAIPAPAGYHRIPADSNSFAAWLRTVPLKGDKRVHLYNGLPKLNQEAQFAVLDVSVGDKDLQQCADAVMRLRAEYLYSRKDLNAISFRTQQGVWLNFGEWARGKRWKLSGDRLVAVRSGAGDPISGHGPLNPRATANSLPDGASSGHGPYDQGPSNPAWCANRKCFWDYLETVFAYCGTLSLERQLDPLPRNRDLQIGDVLIHGGSPGHAMLVVDMAVDGAGRKIYMLSQGYMPAQDIHIVNNPSDGGLSPWYRVEDGPVYTPEYSFSAGQWRRWPASIPAQPCNR